MLGLNNSTLWVKSGGNKNHLFLPIIDSENPLPWK